MDIVISSMAREKLEEKDIGDEYLKIYFGGFG